MNFCTQPSEKVCHVSLIFENKIFKIHILRMLDSKFVLNTLQFQVSHSTLKNNRVANLSSIIEQ